MNDITKAAVLSVAVLFASLAILAVPVSAEDATEAAADVTAEDFLKGVSDDGKLIMDKDVRLTTALTISTELVLDLNGHKLVNGCNSHTITVSKDGKLTVTDSKGTGIVDNINHGKAALYIDAGATVILNGGTFERSAEAGSDPETSGSNSWYTIANRGKLTINDGVTVLNGDAEKTGRFSSMIGNGYPNAKDNTDSHDVVLTINGGTFIGGLYNIKNDDYGVLTINGGTFKASSGLCNILSWNDLTINDGKFVSEVGAVNAYDTSATYNRGFVKIYGGTFDCPDRIVYLGMSEKSTYDVDIYIYGIAEGRTVIKTEAGIRVDGTVHVNKDSVELIDIIAGAGFMLSAGSIEISGAYTSNNDGIIIVHGDAKISGAIDPSVTVRVASGSITVPEGKSLTGTIYMSSGSTVALDGITAGKGGLTITPKTVCGTAIAFAEGSSMTVSGSVSVASGLRLVDVELSVPKGSKLTVAENATVSGGTIANAGSIEVEGTVETPITNTDDATVTATAAAHVSKVEGGSFVQDKPTIQVIDCQYLKLGQSLKIAVVVSEGATVQISGASWASYEDGFIIGTPGKVAEYTIVATPEINGNLGDSVSFRVVVESPDEPVEPVTPDEPEKSKDEFSTALKVALIVLVVVALVAIIIVRL